MSALTAVSKNEQTRSSGSDSVPCCLSKVEAKRMYDRERYLKNAQARKDQVSKWRSENPKKVNAAARERYAKNPEKWADAGARYRAENAGKVKAAYKKYREGNLESERSRQARWRSENPEKEVQKHRRARDELKDSYVRSQLSRRSSLTNSDIPQELVELKRKQMEIHRKLKENEQ